MKKNKKQQDEDQACFLRQQSLYNETGDMKYIWSLWEIFNSVAESVLKKAAHNHKVEDLKDRAEDIATMIITRYSKNKNYSFNNLAALVRFASLRTIYDRNYGTASFDELQEVAGDDIRYKTLMSGEQEDDI